MQPASFSYRFLDSYDAPYEFIRIESRDNVDQRHSTFDLCNEKVGVSEKLHCGDFHVMLRNRAAINR